MFNLEETQRQYKDNVDEHRKEQPNFKVEEPSSASMTTYQNNKTIEGVGHQRLGLVELVARRGGDVIDVKPWGSFITCNKFVYKF